MQQGRRRRERLERDMLLSYIIDVGGEGVHFIIPIPHF
jgi:DNA primase